MTFCLLQHLLAYTKFVLWVSADAHVLISKYFYFYESPWILPPLSKFVIVASICGLVQYMAFPLHQSNTPLIQYIPWPVVIQSAAANNWDLLPKRGIVPCLVFFPPFLSFPLHVSQSV